LRFFLRRRSPPPRLPPDATHHRNFSATAGIHAAVVLSSCRVGVRGRRVHGPFPLPTAGRAPCCGHGPLRPALPVPRRACLPIRAWPSAAAFGVALSARQAGAVCLCRAMPCSLPSPLTNRRQPPAPRRRRGRSRRMVLKRRGRSWECTEAIAIICVLLATAAVALWCLGVLGIGISSTAGRGKRTRSPPLRPHVRPPPPRRRRAAAVTTPTRRRK
jgi:hypothetical protein